MQRPTVLLALGKDFGDHSDALARAGFDLLTELSPTNPPPDLAVLDCDLPAERAAAVYRALHA